MASGSQRDDKAAANGSPPAASRSVTALLRSWVRQAREPLGAPAHDAVARRRGLGALAFFGCLFAMVAIYLVGWESDPLDPWPVPRWTDAEVKTTYVRLAFGALVAVCAYFVARRYRKLREGLGRRLVIVALMVMVTGACMFYFMGVKGLRNAQYSHRHDTYHYLLGPKYYNEINYFDLYRCTVQAAPKIRGQSKTRDLSTYKGVRVDDLRAGPDCEAQFTPERWAEFQGDLAVYAAERGYRAFGGMIRDLGYNGTPSHSVVAGFVANQFELSSRAFVLAPLFDVGFICLALSAIVWGFGWRMGLTLALFYFVDAVDRYTINGGSFFRHFWFMSLAIGLACLRRARYGWAGFWMTASAAMNVFPAVFLLGLMVKAGFEWIRDKRFPARVRPFLVGLALATCIFGGAGATTDRGMGAYDDFFANMEVHNVRGRYPGFGVGFKFVLVDYGRPRTKQGLDQKIKAKEFERLKVLHHGVGLLMLALCGWVSTRLEDERAAVLTGMVAMFCFLETTGYYFIVIALLLLVWRPRAREPTGAAMIIALFGVNAWAMRSLHEHHQFYMFNKTLSAWMMGYLVLTLALLAVETGIWAHLRALLLIPDSEGGHGGATLANGAGEVDGPGEISTPGEAGEP